MTEKLLRLRYKGKIVGYIMIRHGNIFLYKELEYSHESVENWFDEQVYFDSFDPSIKQGDEWFFEGDEVETSEQLQGKLECRKVAWFLVYDTVNHHHYEKQLSENDTLTLIRRAV